MRIRTSIVRDEESPMLLKVALGTKIASIWEMMELSAKVLILAEKYKAKYIQLKNPPLNKEETKVLQFQLKFPDERSIKKFLRSYNKIS